VPLSRDTSSKRIRTGPWLGRVHVITPFVEITAPAGRPEQRVSQVLGGNIRIGGGVREGYAVNSAMVRFGWAQDRGVLPGTTTR